MKTRGTALHKLQFGRLDANDEAVVDPGLLLDGYLDYKDAVYRIITRHAWYLLGPKGAGKSAVFEHIRLKWEDRHDRFFVSWDLRGFPVADVTQIQTGQSLGPSRTQSAWEFLLLLRVFQTLVSDQGISAPAEFWTLRSELAKNGLLGDDWKLSISRWSSTNASFKVSLPFFGLDVANRPVGPLEVTSVLRAALGKVSTNSQHVVSVDGLDSFFLETADEWSSLAGLVHAIESVNRYFAAIRLPVTVVAAIRTEAFEALESTDSNKLKSHSVYLDWSPSGVGPESKLWELVNSKVRVFHPEIKNFIREFLSTDIGQGPYNRIPEYFLSYTRLLPRDMIALLTHLQEVHPGAGAVTEREAALAVKNYSEQYFVGEVFNNLAGILADKQGRQGKNRTFFESVKNVRTAEFDFGEVQDDISGELSDMEIRQLLRQMFEVGAIGMRTRSDRGDRTDFNYRKATAVAFNARRTLVLHNALITAWNKPRS